ncbi:unnamed protein product [Schistosoma curassoni]|uniref:BZIP domain-containing protein n=1 Tax=Schistosoma curassoni TaxID=6186 RepID=A0A183JZJ6_9TREM|nr:unnamed protein product [Schistosoma curassoni]
MNTAIKDNRTRTEKVKAQAECSEANKQVKRSIRANKQKYVEELATTVEIAIRGGNMRQLYDTTKKLAGKFSKLERPIKKARQSSRTGEQVDGEKHHQGV